jgi:hypothetical protein
MKTIQINNKHCQEFNVVMLPCLTQVKNTLCFIGNVFRFQKGLITPGGNIKPLHLYILSNEKINPSEYYINNNVLFKADDKFDEGNNPNQNKNNKKVIATTDSSLQIKASNGSDISWDLPQIPQQFIEHFINEFNKGNVITDVMVEVEGYKPNEMIDEATSYRIKFNQNNEISMLIEKNEKLLSYLQYELTHYIDKKHNQDQCSGFIDGFERACELSEKMYTIEEVKELLINFSNEHGTSSNKGAQRLWIENNLK